MSKPIDSFFDDENVNIEDFKIWKKPKGKIIISPEDIVCMATFERKSKKKDSLIENYFILTYDYLFMLESEKSDKILAFMETENMRNDCFVKVLDDNETIYSFRFIKNLKYFDIFTNDKVLFDKWKDIFPTIFIQCDFHKKYKNLKVIGKGSYARVYLVENLENGKRSAVKAFRKKYLIENQNNSRQAIKNEIQILRRLRHTHIMNLEEIQESQNSIYMVLELLEGGELLQFVYYQQSYTLKDILMIMKDILETLQFMHEKNIMHRDIKPENILLKNKKPLNQNCLKIVDFGLSTKTNVEEFLFKRCGTPGYVAPEIINCSDNSVPKYGPLCDIFSAGVIFYILLTERSPFEGNFQQVVQKNKDCNIDFDHPSIKYKDLKDLLKKMLKKNPDERISAKEAVQHHLFQLIEIEDDQKIKSKYNHYREKNIKINSDDDCSLIIREKIFNGKTDTVKDSLCSEFNSFGKGSDIRYKSKKKSNSMLKLVLLSGVKKKKNEEDCYLDTRFSEEFFDSDDDSKK
jgi:serine/threonine protein kinase